MASLLRQFAGFLIICEGRRPVLIGITNTSLAGDYGPQGVSFEDRQDLLGHKSGRITTHYSAAERHNLIEAANRVSDENARKSPALIRAEDETIIGCLLEAVIDKNAYEINWRELQDSTRWLTGWK